MKSMTNTVLFAIPIFVAALAAIWSLRYRRPPKPGPAAQIDLGYSAKNTADERE